MTPDMSRILGKFISTLSLYEREHWDLVYLPNDQETALAKRIYSLGSFVNELHDRLDAHEYMNQMELDRDEEELYQSIMGYPDRELVEEILSILRESPDIPAEERKLLKLE